MVTGNCGAGPVVQGGVSRDPDSSLFRKVLVTLYTLGSACAITKLRAPILHHRTATYLPGDSSLRMPRGTGRIARVRPGNWRREPPGQPHEPPGNPRPSGQGGCQDLTEYLPADDQPHKVTGRIIGGEHEHEHRYSGQLLRHAHPDGYYQHPEDLAGRP